MASPLRRRSRKAGKQTPAFTAASQFGEMPSFGFDVPAAEGNGAVHREGIQRPTKTGVLYGKWSCNQNRICNKVA
jgi:hypothetical protein